MKQTGAGPLWVIGWREWLALPDLHVPAIKAKIDTGARTSALHAMDVRYFRRGGRRMVRFAVCPLQRSRSKRVIAEAALADERVVRTSAGHEQLRPVIVTRATVRDREWEIELTLTGRDEMGFRMLLGREALRGLFVVDPHKSFTTGKPRLGLTKSKRKNR